MLSTIRPVASEDLRPGMQILSWEACEGLFCAPAKDAEMIFRPHVWATVTETPVWKSLEDTAHYVHPREFFDLTTDRFSGEAPKGEIHWVRK